LEAPDGTPPFDEGFHLRRLRQISGKGQAVFRLQTENAEGRRRANRQTVLTLDALFRFVLSDVGYALVHHQNTQRAITDTLFTSGTFVGVYFQIEHTGLHAGMMPPSGVAMCGIISMAAAPGQGP
jgi:hypothetical protein